MNACAWLKYILFCRVFRKRDGWCPEMKAAGLCMQGRDELPGVDDALGLARIQEGRRWRFVYKWLLNEDRVAVGKEKDMGVDKGQCEQSQSLNSVYICMQCVFLMCTLVRIEIVMCTSPWSTSEGNSPPLPELRILKLFSGM